MRISLRAHNSVGRRMTSYEVEPILEGSDSILSIHGNNPSPINFSWLSSGKNEERRSPLGTQKKFRISTMNKGTDNDATEKLRRLLNISLRNKECLGKPCLQFHQVYEPSLCSYPSAIRCISLLREPSSRVHTSEGNSKRINGNIGKPDIVQLPFSSCSIIRTLSQSDPRSISSSYRILS